MILQDALTTAQAAAQAQRGISSIEAKEIARLSAPEQAKLLWTMQSAPEHSIVDDVFAGQQQSTAQCRVCRHDQLRFERVIALELSLPDMSDPKQGCTLQVLNRLPFFCHVGHHTVAQLSWCAYVQLCCVWLCLLSPMTTTCCSCIQQLQLILPWCLVNVVIDLQLVLKYLHQAN